MSRPPNGIFARSLVSHLAANGVGRFVLCPGSRSGPLAHALAEAAQLDPPNGAPSIDLHVRVDERAAGFLALGLSLATGEPVAVVTTSGTAVGNLLPAVMEAHHAGVPLILLTADRPFGVRGTGANQTTDQRGIFGRFVQWSADVVPPGPGRDVAGEAAALAAQATAWAEGSAPDDHPSHDTVGPVHLNVQFDAPLDAEPAPWTWGREAKRPDLTEEPVPDLPSGVRGVVVAGHAAGPGAASIASARGWPLFAEPTSGARSGNAAVPGYLDVLASDRGRALSDDIQFVLGVGRPTLSREVARIIRDAPRLWVARWGARWRDAPLAAEVVARDIPFEWMRGSVASVDLPAPETWLARWHELGRESAVETWGPRAIAASVAESVGGGDTLVVGSSGPIRALDAVLPIRKVTDSPRILANRGLSGIDGTVSTAVGVALARPGRTVALVGDLTFLHDIGGLLVGSLERRPDLRVVVVNDGGGSIFASLEHASAPFDRFDRVFTAPHGADLASICAGYGVPHVAVSNREELRVALAAPVRGIDVIEAIAEVGPPRRMPRPLAAG